MQTAISIVYFITIALLLLIVGCAASKKNQHNEQRLSLAEQCSINIAPLSDSSGLEKHSSWPDSLYWKKALKTETDSLLLDFKKQILHFNRYHAITLVTENEAPTYRLTMTLLPLEKDKMKLVPKELFLRIRLQLEGPGNLNLQTFIENQSVLPPNILKQESVLQWLSLFRQLRGSIDWEPAMTAFFYDPFVAKPKDF